MKTRSGFVMAVPANQAAVTTRPRNGAVLDPTKRSRLPPELYREILQRLSRQDLVPLLATSCDLRFEAMRLYFSHIELVDDHRRLIERFSKFRAYVGPLVKTLIVRRLSRSNASHIYSLLLSVPHLEYLHVSLRNYDTATNRFLPPRPPFQLRTLMIERRNAPKSLTAFVKTQRASLVRLHVDCEALDFRLPRLRVVGGYGNLIASLTPTVDIRCVELLSTYVTSAISGSPVRALRVFRPYGGLLAFPMSFPNLHFLEIRWDFRFDMIVQTPAVFQSLQKLVIHHGFPSNSTFSFSASAADWFQYNPSLEFIEVVFVGSQWSFQRGSPEIHRSSADGYDEEEWLRYQDPGYCTRE